MKRVASTILTLISVGMFILACVLYAENETTEDHWNQYRGPNGDGKATATHLHQPHRTLEEEPCS